MPGRMLAGGRRRGAAPKPPAPAPAPAPPPAADLDADPVPEQQSPVAARTSKVQFAAKQPTPREVPANAIKKKVVLLDSDDESDAPQGGALRRVGWFVALWAGGVLTVGVVGFAIKLVLMP